MTDQDVAAINDAIGSVNARLGKVISVFESTGETQQVLAETMIETNKKTQDNTALLNRQSKTLAVVVLSILLNLILLVTAVSVLLSNRETAKQTQRTAAAIIDCTTPEGNCTKRQVAGSVLFLASMKYAGEQERIITQLPIARAKGDIITVDEYTSRLAELATLLAATNKQLEAIRSQSQQEQ